MIRCSLCGRRAVYSRRYAGAFLCDRCLIRSVERRVRRAIAAHKLIRPGEQVAMALSGGKDSVVCLHILADYCRRRACELVAVSVDEGIKGYRDESLSIARENAELLGVQHYIVSFERAFGATLDRMVELAEDRGTGPNPCTYCGVMRRSLLNQAARELGADKLATAHNLDDEAQAILLNYVRADLMRLHRLGFAYEPREDFVPRIKPLREIPEKEVALYAMLRGLKAHFAVCPYAGGIHFEIRDFLNRLEMNHPNSKFAVLRTFDRMRPYISQMVPPFAPRDCEVCGEPTSADICKPCELLGGLGLKRKEKTLIQADIT